MVLCLVVFAAPNHSVYLGAEVGTGALFISVDAVKAILIASVCALLRSFC